MSAANTAVLNPAVAKQKRPDVKTPGLLPDLFKDRINFISIVKVF